jgi:hypothetical protein
MSVAVMHPLTTMTVKKLSLRSSMLFGAVALNDCGIDYVCLKRGEKRAQEEDK